MKYTNECGRSMVEMLGVLAIISVLSAGGLAGYSKAMQKIQLQKTFSLVSDALMQYALFVKHSDLSGYPNGFAFVLYDNGGKNGAYTSNCNGSLTFTAPEGLVFRISGTGRTESGYDLLSICDSDLTALLGGSTYSGAFTVDEVFSAGYPA